MSFRVINSASFLLSGLGGFGSSWGKGGCMVLLGDGLWTGEEKGSRGDTLGVLGRRRLEAEAGHSIMFELVQPNRGFRDHACSKQRAFHPAATRPKTYYLSGDRADRLHPLYLSQSDSWVFLRTPRSPRRTTPSSPLVSRPGNPSTARRT